MSDLAAKLSSLNPFRFSREDEDDKGDVMAQDSVGGGGPTVYGNDDTSKGQLRVSHALRSFLAHHKVLSERDAGLKSDEPTRALQNLLEKSHIHIPRELVDTSHPLPEYFVSSSHNTYLLAHQLYGQSSASAYETAIKTGSRCVEIDAWDNSDNVDEPKVTHGYTFVSNVLFRSVCEKIRSVFDEELAVAATQQPGRSVTPILLSLENHCGPHGQLRLVQIMRDVFGDRLLTEAVRARGTYPPPPQQQQLLHDDSQHVTLDDIGAKIVVIVEFHLPDEATDSDSVYSEEDSGDEEQRNARKAYKDKKKATPSSIIIPELAALGIYAQSVKPKNNSWYDPGVLVDGPHHHLINVSESGLSAHLPAKSSQISRHNARHLMRVYPKGTRISSSNLKAVPFWGIGAQIAALNWQTFGTSNQLNNALFHGSGGYILKPAALRAGGDGNLGTGRKRRLLLRVAAVPDVHSVQPPGPPRCGASQAQDGILQAPPVRVPPPGENPPATDPVWDETLEWEYEDNELVFVRMLIKSDDSWARNPKFAVAAVRLMYLVPGWTFVRMMDLKGRETACTLLVKFDFEDI
ncbi:1-phosphatidylinositol 4,5-bisphosphate phosphodiesterase 1-like protein [Cladobotryum mycophilum]|uniref:Phosphoinositide phospholipase C n=1 Tax=Cladobotryum mycophilum TaxID=491253 RepID=A0ABR0SHY7_9HYPO